ncbi:SDR family oxidoreductase [Chloroflexota bacterium]
MKKVVVTGGAGFIGSSLTKELVSRNYDVTVIDDLSTGKTDNIKELLSEGKVSFIKDSILNLSLLQKLFQSVDYVFHQAAIPSVPRSVDNPELSHEVNITGTLNVLLSARDNKVKKVIYASSSSVYGESQSLPKREDMLPGPLSPYAVTKLAGEYYCQIFQHVYGLTTVCLRYFNVYGPGQDPDSQYAAVVPLFIKSSLGGESLAIFGDGEQTRDFTFVKDVVDANIQAAESDATGLFNISRGESITLNKLAQLIIELVGNKVEPIHQEPRIGDVKHSLADISKAKTFGYIPKYDLRTGLIETIKWFNSG